MTSEVQWVLDQLGSVAGSLSTPLRRVDRDDSTILEGDIRSRTADLKDANYVGATLADRSTEPVGTEYDHRVEVVVGVRIEGLHHSEWGHVDPGGVEGVAFDELVRRCRDAILANRTYPSVGSPDGTYHSLQVTNESPGSAAWADYYRHDFDVLFQGFEDV